VFPVFTRATLASVSISCFVCLSVCLSVTGRCSTETAKRRIMQTRTHDSPGTLVFWCRKYQQNSNRVTPNEGSKCRWGRLNAGEVAENWQLSTQSVVNLARLQVYHTQHPPARSPCCSGVCQRQLILVWLRISSGQQATDDVVIVGPSVYYPVYFVGLLEECTLTPFDAFLMKNETYDLKVASQVTPAVRNFLWTLLSS